MLLSSTSFSYSLIIFNCIKKNKRQNFYMYINKKYKISVMSTSETLFIIYILILEVLKSLLVTVCTKTLLLPIQ